MKPEDLLFSTSHEWAHVAAEGNAKIATVGISAFAVNLKDRDFVGKAALAPLQHDPQQLRRVGLELSGKRVPREHFSLFAGDDRIGVVTSGTFSPTLNRPIAMAYVQPQFAVVDTHLFVDIRGSHEPASVVKLPFYSRRKT